MAKGQPVMRAVLGKPFAEQAAFFRNKLGNLVPTERWDDIQRDAHDTGFMIAGAAKADLLTDLAAAVDRAITEGRGLGEFRKDFRSIVERNGWHGWTGESTAAGQRWRTRTIYQTNAMTSYAAGRLAQLKESGFDLLVYKHNDSVRYPRPEHERLNGLTLPADHPFWKRYYPPNGWGCQCYVVGARSAAGARRLGGNPDTALPEGWDADKAPGIDNGWDYQPGARVAQTVSLMAKKSQAWPADIAKAYMGNVPEHLRDSMAISYRALPSVADDARRYAQRVLKGESAARLPASSTLGPLTLADVDQVSKLADLKAAGYDFALDAAAVRASLMELGAKRTATSRPVQVEDFALLPKLLSNGGPLKDAGRSAAGNPLLQREVELGGVTFIATFEVKRAARSLVLQSLHIRGDKR